MSQNQEQFKTSLRLAKLSLTEPRSCVFTALEGKEPMTMAELVSRCKSIDRASVYRTVNLFEKLGILQRLQQGWKYKLELTDAFHEHHHHASCLSCGRLISLPENSIIEDQLYRMAKSRGFQVQKHQLELEGICQTCQAKNK